MKQSNELREILISIVTTNYAFTSQFNIDAAEQQITKLFNDKVLSKDQIEEIVINNSYGQPINSKCYIHRQDLIDGIHEAQKKRMEG